MKQKWYLFFGAYQLVKKNLFKEKINNKIAALSIMFIMQKDLIFLIQIFVVQKQIIICSYSFEALVNFFLVTNVLSSA